MTKRVKKLEVRVTLLLFGQSDFRLITKRPTRYGGQIIRTNFQVIWSSRVKIDELAMALVKVGGHIQALAALLTRKGSTHTPHPLSGPKVRTKFFASSGNRNTITSSCTHSLFRIKTELSLLFSRLLPTQTEENGSSGNTSLYSEEDAFESQQGHR